MPGLRTYSAFTGRPFMAIELPHPLRPMGIRLMEKLRRTHALKLLPQLLESEKWSLAELELLQIRRLRELGEFCRHEVDWYQEKFSRAGIDDGTPVTPQTLEQFPLLRKETIREAGDRLKSASFTKWKPRAKSTSGSTGIPLNYYLDRPSHSYQWGHLWRGWHQVGFTPGDLYATLSGGSLVPEKVDFKQRIYLLLSGAIHLPSYHLTEEVMSQYLDLLGRKEVPFLYGYPCSLELLAEFILNGSDRALPMQAVFTTSEVLTPKARQAIQNAFGCPVIDTYGCNDGGLYSYECSNRNGFHVGMESVYVEITDDEGRRLPDGETGNIVSTNLVMRAMPLMRYMTGDVGAICREPCPCGRGLLRIVDLQGRERDFVLTKAGHRVHGAFFNHFDPFYRAEWLHRFQVYQPDRETLIVRVMVHREPTSEECEDLIGELRRGLGEMDIRLEVVDEMETTRTGKFRVIISDIA